MSRVSEADQLLIQAAQEMLKHSGMSSMNLRDLAKKAGVNSGMFHYHFKTKERFMRAVLQDLYEKFFKDFSLGVDQERTALEKLRKALFKVGQFSRDNRKLILSMLQDVLAQNKLVRDFFKDNSKRHGEVILRLLGQCKKEGIVEKRPDLQIACFLMTAINAPAMAIGIVENVEKTLLVKLFLKHASSQILSDKALRERVEMALRGVGVPEGNRT